AQEHSEREWFEATHATQYSNAVISLHEQFRHWEPVELPAGASEDAGLLRRLEERRRRLVEPDLLIFASNHWNFNVRGFNPGGNHGSLLRLSTHSVLLISGGKDTGIPRGLRVATPYDSLSFVPTILALMGKPEPALPGPVIAGL